MGKIGIIIGREFSTRVRKKRFIVVTLVMPLLMLALMTVPTLIAMYGGSSQSRSVVVIDDSGEVGKELVSSENVSFVASSSSYPEVVSEHPNAFGYLVIGSDVMHNESDIKLYSAENSTASVDDRIESEISRIVTTSRIERSGVESLDSIMAAVQARAHLSTYQISVNEAGNVDEKASSSFMNMGVSYIGGILIYMFIFIYGMMVLSSVVEEKSSRVMEIMVSSVRPFELMMGKILGVGLVALLQFGIWVVLVVIGVSAFAGSGVAMPAEVSAVGDMLLDGSYIVKVGVCFVFYFVGGYLLYSSMFAAVGSAVDSAADTQQLQLPVTIPLMVAFFIMMSVMQEPNSSLAFWSSMIPFTSPVVMMARVSYGVPLWELILSIVILYGSFLAITYFAAKIYRIGIFMYGKRPTIMDLIRWTGRKF